MGYEDAPATQMLATSCCACGRPLVDSASVEAGMGPDCRSKYGIVSLDDETRKAANVHIYHIALHQEGPEATSHLASLRQLGLNDLADRIVKRLASNYVAVMTDEGASFSVKASYDVSMRANLGIIAGGRWDKERKVRVFPASAKRGVFAALKKSYPGMQCLGNKGEFTL